MTCYFGTVQTMSGPSVRPSVSSEPEVDRALAGLLIAEKRVCLPKSRAWEDELLDLMVTARRRLASSASVFLMGETHVSLFLITRDDIASVAPHLVPTDDNVASKHRKPRGERPAVRPVSDRTDAWTAPPVVREPPLQEFSAEFELAEFEVYEAELHEPDPDSADLADIVKVESDPASDEELADLDDEITRRGAWQRRGTSRWVVTIGAATIGVALVGGLSALLVTTADGTSGPQAATSAPTPMPTPDAPIPDAAALRKIAMPVESYVKPPTVTAEPQRSNRGTQRPRPRGRWLPNPIPGLPPIRLP